MKCTRQLCDNTFEQSSDQRMYCSKFCRDKDKMKGRVVKCRQCGTETYKSKSRLEMCQKHFCSKDCYLKHKASKRMRSETKKEIMKQLFGPYEREWYNAKGQVENSDSAIAKRLKLSRDSIQAFTTVASERRVEYINSLINNDVSDTDKTKLMREFDLTLIE